MFEADVTTHCTLHCVSFSSLFALPVFTLPSFDTVCSLDLYIAIAIAQLEAKEIK